MPTKIGSAKRLCTAPVRLGTALAGAVLPPSPSSDEGGGKPPTGSVTNTPDPIRPTPTAPTSTGTSRDPTIRGGHRARSGAATRYIEPVSMKFERWSHPRRPAPSELTACRRQSYPLRRAPMAVKALTNSGPAIAANAIRTGPLGGRGSASDMMGMLSTTTTLVRPTRSLFRRPTP